MFKQGRSLEDDDDSEGSDREFIDPRIPGCIDLVRESNDMELETERIGALPQEEDFYMVSDVTPVETSKNNMRITRRNLTGMTPLITESKVPRRTTSKNGTGIQLQEIVIDISTPSSIPGDPNETTIFSSLKHVGAIEERSRIRFEDSSHSISDEGATYGNFNVDDVTEILERPPKLPPKPEERLTVLSRPNERGKEALEGADKFVLLSADKGASVQDVAIRSPRPKLHRNQSENPMDDDYSHPKDWKDRAQNAFDFSYHREEIFGLHSKHGTNESIITSSLQSAPAGENLKIPEDADVIFSREYNTAVGGDGRDSSFRSRPTLPMRRYMLDNETELPGRVGKNLENLKITREQSIESDDITGESEQSFQSRDVNDEPDIEKEIAYNAVVEKYIVSKAQSDEVVVKVNGIGDTATEPKSKRGAVRDLDVNTISTDTKTENEVVALFPVLNPTPYSKYPAKDGAFEIQNKNLELGNISPAIPLRNVIQFRRDSTENNAADQVSSPDHPSFNMLQNTPLRPPKSINISSLVGTAGEVSSEGEFESEAVLPISGKSNKNCTGIMIKPEDGAMDQVSSNEAACKTSPKGIESSILQILVHDNAKIRGRSASTPGKPPVPPPVLMKSPSTMFLLDRKRSQDDAEEGYLEFDPQSADVISRKESTAEPEVSYMIFENQEAETPTIPPRKRPGKPGITRIPVQEPILEEPETQHANVTTEVEETRTQPSPARKNFIRFKYKKKWMIYSTAYMLLLFVSFTGIILNILPQDESNLNVNVMPQISHPTDPRPERSGSGQWVRD